MRFFEMHKHETVALNADIEDSKINQQKITSIEDRTDAILSELTWLVIVQGYIPLLVHPCTYQLGWFS